MRKIFPLLIFSCTVLIFCGCDKIPEALRRAGVKKYFAEESGRIVMTSQNGTQIQLVSGSAAVHVDKVPLILPEALQLHDIQQWDDYLLLVDNIFAPLLNPQKKSIRKIVIDPGHGGKDNGAKSVTNALEKNLNLSLAKALQKELTAAGYQVIMTRDRDVFISLDSRAAIANTLEADLFISIHHNSSATNPKASGMETFVIRPETDIEWQRCRKSVLLALLIQKEQFGVNGSFGRGVKFARFKVLRLAECPALLIENAFLSNREDAEKSASETHRKMVSVSITRALLASYPPAIGR